MNSIGYFILGVSIPLLIVIIFWKELRSRRERVISFFKSKFSK